MDETSQTIETVDDLETAITNHQSYAKRLAALETAEQAEVDAILAKRAADKKQLAERVAELDESITRYTLDHKADIFTGKGKSREFAAATLKIANTPEAVVFDENSNRADIVDRLTKGSGIFDAIARLLKRLKLNNWLRLKVELDIKAIKDAHKAGKIKPRKLASYGMKVERSTKVTIAARS